MKGKVMNNKKMKVEIMILILMENEEMIILILMEKKEMMEIYKNLLKMKEI